MQTLYSLLLLGLLFLNLSAFALCEYNGKILDSSRLGPEFIKREPENFTGKKVCRFHDKEQIQSSTDYVNGKKQGLEIRYDEKTGEKREEAQMADDKLHGVVKRYHFRTFKIQTEFTYKNGKMEGLQKYYDENGKLERMSMTMPVFSERSELYYNPEGRLHNLVCGKAALPNDRMICGRDGEGMPTPLYFNDEPGSYGKVNQIVRYKNLKRDGEQRVIDKEGKTISTKVYKDGEEVSYVSGDGRYKDKLVNGITERTSYFDDGKLEEKILLKGHNVISKEQYYQNGKIKSREGHDKKGLVSVTTFHDIGGKNCQYQYKPRTYWARDLEGNYECWSEKGAPVLKGQYTHGRRNGEFITHFEEGTLKEIYEMGVLKKSEHLDINGKVIESAEYEADGSRKLAP